MAGKLMTRMTSALVSFALVLQRVVLSVIVDLLICGGIAVALAVLVPSLAIAI